MLAYLGTFIDAGKGIKYNIDKGSSWERTASDALADLAISGGSIWFSIKLGGLIGAKIGTKISPGIGTIVGAVAGLLIGIVLYILTDGIEVEGKIIRDHTNDYISDYYGWD